MSDLVRPPAAPAPLPAVEEASRSGGRAAARPSGASPHTIVADLQIVVASVRDSVKVGAAPSWPEVERVLDRVVASLEQSPALFWLANGPEVSAGVDDLVAYQSRVAVVAVRIGLNIGYGRMRAVRVGMAGALMDIALWQAAEDLRSRVDDLTPAEHPAYATHPEQAGALLTEWGAPAALIEPVLQHHERERGEGFPRRLTGGTINPDAKILGLADRYTALTLPGARRSGLKPHEALRRIVGSKGESFSPTLVKALLSEISVFPPGTLVRLNTGAVGRVSAVNGSHPLRPRVEVVSDAMGRRPLSPTTIDLCETPFLYITGTVPESTT